MKSMRETSLKWRSAPPFRGQCISKARSTRVWSGYFSADVGSSFSSPPVLYGANDKSNNNIGIAEDTSFQLGRHTLQANSIVIADHLGAVDFFLDSDIFPVDVQRSRGLKNV